MRYFLTFDVGTTAVKVSIISEELNIATTVIKEYTLETAEGGIVELDPEVYWKNAVEGVREALSKTGVAASDIVSATCTTQGETLIPVDKGGNALGNAIVWLDSRARDEAEFIASKVSDGTFYQKTGVPEINGYCPVAKLLWIKNNLPECYENTYKFLLPEDYLIYRLSGEFVTNPSVICTSGYFDINTNEIWDDIFSLTDLDKDKIPFILPCGTVVGKLCDEAVSAMGLSPDTVVTTGAMDQTAGALGCANVSEGMVSETTGTAMVIAATVKEPELDKLSSVNVYTHAIPGLFLDITMVQTAGILQKWFRDEFCKDLDKKEAFVKMSEMAEATPPLSKGVMLYPHFTGIQEPQNDPFARGVFFGVGLDADRGCFVRAIYEGIAYALRENLEIMKLEPKKILSLGGGSKSSIWNQIKADVCSTGVEVPEESETTSLGAAILGGLAAGVFPDIETAVNRLGSGKSYVPDEENTKLYEGAYKKYTKMYEQFKPLFGEE